MPNQFQKGAAEVTNRVAKFGISGKLDTYHDVKMLGMEKLPGSTPAPGSRSNPKQKCPNWRC